MLFILLDYVVFNVIIIWRGYLVVVFKVLIILDYSVFIMGVCVDVFGMLNIKCIKLIGYVNVVMIFDFLYNDYIVGNK